MQKYIYFSILQNKSSFIFRKGMRVEFFFVSFAQEKINRDVALDDVMVTGTKVKLAYRGDMRLASPFVLQRQADAEDREMEQYAAKLLIQVIMLFNSQIDEFLSDLAIE